MALDAGINRYPTYGGHGSGILLSRESTMVYGARTIRQSLQIVRQTTKLARSSFSGHVLRLQASRD
jgi:hypothetical protein